MAISVGNLPGSSRPEDRGNGFDDLDPAACEAFDAFYREFVPRVAGYVRRHIHDFELIDEIVQETLLRAYRHGLHLEEGDEHWRWLATVARNLCIDQRALHRNWRESSVEEPETLDLTVYDADPEARLVAAERQEIVARVLAQLSERQRRLLVQKHVEGRRLREMATLEGMHVEALKSALRRARKAFEESYAAVTDRTGVASVFGPIAAAVGLRMREIKARIGAIGDQVTTLAAHVTTSSGFFNTATTAAVVFGLALGPGLGSLAPDGGGLDGRYPDSDRRGELVMGDDGYAGAPTLARSTHDGFTGPSTADRAWLHGSGVEHSGGPHGDGSGSDADQGSDGDGDDDDDGPFSPFDRPESIDPPPPSAPATNGDAGPDSAEAPEDAHITDLVYAGGSSAGDSSSQPAPSEADDDADEDERDVDGEDEEVSGEDAEAEGTRGNAPEEQDTHGSAQGEATADSREDASESEHAGGESEHPEKSAPPTVFAVGEPKGAAAQGCYAETQCEGELALGPSPCQVQCSVLFRSIDGGVSWEKLPAHGLEGERLLVPPTYPNDRRIYALGRLGLMVSTDDGHMFQIVASLPDATSADFWPGFGEGDDRIVVGADSGVWIHHSDSGVTKPFGAPVTDVANVSAIVNSQGDRAVIVAGMPSRRAIDNATTSTNENYSHAVLACSAPWECERKFVSSTAPSVFSLGQDANPLVEGSWGPYYGAAYGPHWSRDAGRSFEPVALPPLEEDEGSWRPIRDVARGSERSVYAVAETRGTTMLPDGHRRLIDRTRILASDDGGETWQVWSRPDDGVRLHRIVALPEGRLIAAGSTTAFSEHSYSGREVGSSRGYLGVMCSEDGGRTWHERCHEAP